MKKPKQTKEVSVISTEDTWSAKDLHRPQLFKHFIGQEHAISILEGQIAAGKMSRSYLITGVKGDGKTSLSRVIAKKVAGLKTHKHTDIIEYNAVVDTGIDDIRSLIERISFKPLEANKKVVIVDEAQGLTGKAASAMLITLENPPEHVVIIMSTNESEKLPATIRDRCKKIELRPLSSENITLLLKRAADKEGVFQPTSDHEKLFNVLGSLFPGRNRDALNTLSNLADISRKRKIVKEDILKFMEKELGLAYSDIPKFLGCIYKGDVKEAFEILSRVTDYNSFSFVLLDLNTYALKKMTGLEPPFNYGAKILIPYLKGVTVPKVNKIQSILIELRREITQTSAVAPEAVIVYHAVRLGEID